MSSSSVEKKSPEKKSAATPLRLVGKDPDPALPAPASKIEHPAKAGSASRRKQPGEVGYDPAFDGEDHHDDGEGHKGPEGAGS